MNKNYDFRQYDIKLIFLLMTTTIMGILVIGSAKEAVQTKQIVGFLLGLFLMVLISFFNYSTLLKLNWLMYFGNLVLLILVQLIGTSSNNAQRWIEIAGIRFQPSETAKILLILFYAQFIMKNEEKLNTLGRLAACVLLILPPWVLIIKQPDLSTSIVLLILFAIIMFIGGVSKKIIIGLIAVMAPIVLIGLFLVVQPDQTIIKDYQQERILAWIYPDKYKLGAAYQQDNSKIALVKV